LRARCPRCQARGHLADETDSLARDGPDQPLLVAIVVDRAPHRIDAAGQRRVGDHASVPDGIEQIVPRHHTVAVADQVVQEIEDLRLDGNQGTGPAQLAAVGIKHEIFELERHVRFGSRTKIKAAST
jgi:hypothetical protein